MQGWICLHREITEHWIWDDKPFSKGQAWIDILLRANHQRDSVLVGTSVYEVDKGEFITSKKKLYESWGWSNRKFDNFFELLQKSKMIAYKKHNNKIVVKVLNYGKYQGFGKSESTQNAYETHTQRTTDAHRKHNESTTKAYRKHSECTQTTMLNNDNNINNIRETIKDRKTERETDFKINKLKAPTLTEINRFIQSENLKCNGNDFFDYYSANGWVVGKTPMQDWKAMCRKWSRTDEKKSSSSGKIKSAPTYDLNKIKADAWNNTEFKE